MCEMVVVGTYELSKIQYTCLSFYVTGHSAKETAAELGKSVKTIETHWRDARNIMGCRRKSRLTIKMHELKHTESCFDVVFDRKNYRKTLSEKP